jgi:hypothetical protein
MLTALVKVYLSWSIFDQLAGWGRVPIVGQTLWSIFNQLHSYSDIPHVFQTIGVENIQGVSSHTVSLQIWG